MKLTAHIFSIKKYTRYIFCAYIFFVALYISHADEKVEPPTVKTTLRKLGESMAEVASVSSDFRQEKKLSLFSKTIVLTGHLTIRFPHYFKWEVYSPVKTVITADGDRITVWDGETGQKNTTDINSNPVVKNIWTQIDSWFMGRYSVLAKDYKIRVANQNPLKLVFTPRAKPLSVAVDSITTFFREDRRYLSKVVLKEKGGDSTVITFSNIKLEEK